MKESKGHYPNNKHGMNMILTITFRISVNFTLLGPGTTVL